MPDENEAVAEAPEREGADDESVAQTQAGVDEEVNGSAPEGGNEQEVSEEALQRAKAELEAEYEQHISNLRSSLMQRHAQERKELQNRLEMTEQEKHELAMQGMDELERAQYERDIYQQRAQQANNKLSQLEADYEATRNMWDYARGLNQAFGVDFDQLDFSSPDRLMETGWQTAAQKFQELQKQVKTDEAPQQETTPQGSSRKKTPPQVVTQQGQAAASPGTFNELKESVSQKLGREVSDAEMFEFHRTGKHNVDLNTLVQAEPE